VVNPSVPCQKLDGGNEMPRQRDQELIKGIGRRVAQARKDRGFTQEALAEAVNIEAVTLSRLETGHRALSLSTLASISKVLDMGIGDLLDSGRELPAPENSPEEVELLRLFCGLTDSQRDVLLRLARELGAQA
jgi:transcriptional regulator with XRE-family HTH domain